MQTRRREGFFLGARNVIRDPRLRAAALVAALAFTGCGDDAVEPAPAPEVDVAQEALPTVAEASAFIVRAESELETVWLRAERAAWVKENFITVDTERLEAEAQETVLKLTADLAVEAARFRDLDLPADVRRKIELLRTAPALVSPPDTAKAGELAGLAAELSSLYGSGKVCTGGVNCRDLGELSRTMATSRDPDELLEAWLGWRTVSPPMRDRYRRFAELANEGARELGFADLGELWRSGYDMPAAGFPAELDRLWEQVRPLYDALHCHVRARLAAHYGTDVVPLDGPIPAHLLGNMWAQSWSNIHDLVAPANSTGGVDLTGLLRQRQVGALEMVRFGERFFTSLGFEPMPPTFWERSLFTQPADRDVVCHASAWDLDMQEDLRIKMCIQINAEDFSTIHHELGHNIYQRAYRHQPPLYRSGANDGFHEGIGDTIALSITPGYLARVGLLDRVSADSGELDFLLRMALDKVAFLPFGLLIDRWRWGVFSGEIPEGRYNQAWWDLRRAYQGVDAPARRGESDFDPGAKYHVPANTPYTRYFLAHILQFQFHRALCDAAGYSGPLHECSIYGSREAGRRLETMLEMGQSHPWPDALEAVTGTREMDATALLDYFEPLRAWLAEENENRSCDS